METVLRLYKLLTASATWRLWIGIRLVLLLLNTITFAAIWTTISDLSDLSLEILLHSFLILSFWLILDMVLLRFCYLEPGRKPLLRTALCNQLFFWLSLPFFFILDATVWTAVVGMRSLFMNIVYVFCVTPNFYALQCLLIFLSFTTVSIFQLLLTPGNWLHSRVTAQDSGKAGTDEEQHPDMITASSYGKKHYIKLEEVIRIEAARYYSRLVLEETDHLVRHSMDTLTENLINKGFRRIHRSHIINIAFLDRIVRRPDSGSVAVLRNGDEIPISRSKLTEFRQSIPSSI